MKRIYLACLILLLELSILHAQTYHPLVESGKLWSTYHQYIPISPPTSDYTKFEGDTTVGPFTYKKVWVANDEGMTQWYNYGVIREDAQKRVYYSYTGPANEFLMYDFSAVAGDTLQLHENPYPYVMDSIGTFTLLSGEQRKSYYLHSTVFICSETWVEGIGSITLGVLNGGMCGAVGDDPTMLCAWENDTLKYHSSEYSDCFIIDGINDPSQTGEALKIFPNPSSGNVIVRFPSPADKCMLVLYDITGRKVRCVTVPERTTTLSVDINGLPPGVYYFIAQKEGLNSRCVKLLVR